MIMEWPQGQTYLGNKVLLIGAGQDVGLGSPAQFTLGEVGVHLVSIEVGVVGLAVGVVGRRTLLRRDAGAVRLGWRACPPGWAAGSRENVPVLHMPAHLWAEQRKGWR